MAPYLKDAPETSGKQSQFSGRVDLRQIDDGRERQWTRWPPPPTKEEAEDVEAGLEDGGRGEGTEEALK